MFIVYVQLAMWLCMWDFVLIYVVWFQANIGSKGGYVYWSLEWWLGFVLIYL